MRPALLSDVVAYRWLKHNTRPGPWFNVDHRDPGQQPIPRYQPKGFTQQWRLRNGQLLQVTWKLPED